MTENSHKSQANFVLDHVVTADDPSLPFATGTVAAPSSTTFDPITGRNYTSLLRGPARLTRTRAENTHRTLTNIPPFHGTGMSLSFWYRHRKECIDPNDACGVYLFAAYSDASANKCWALWVEKAKVGCCEAQMFRVLDYSRDGRRCAGGSGSGRGRD